MPPPKSFEDFLQQCLDYLEGETEDMPSAEALSAEEKAKALHWLKVLNITRKYGPKILEAEGRLK